MAPLGAARRAEYYPSVHAPASGFSAEYDRPMRITLIALGVVLVLGGLVWVAQGLNIPFAPASFMTADRAWIFIGAVAVVAGLVLIGWARQRP